MNNKDYYENLFEGYPDVVSLPEFRRMLGGISDAAARRLVREKRVKSYYVNYTYRIPKCWVIEYVLSDDYQNYKKKLKATI